MTIQETKQINCFYFIDLIIINTIAIITFDTKIKYNDVNHLFFITKKNKELFLKIELVFVQGHLLIDSN